MSVPLQNVSPILTAFFPGILRIFPLRVVDSAPKNYAVYGKTRTAVFCAGKGRDLWLTSLSVTVC